MKAIIIAAGMGRRLEPYTDDCPKCMLPLDGIPIVQHNIALLENNGVNQVSIVVGYMKEKINLSGVHSYINDDFKNNNILFSLMYARQAMQHAAELNEILIISYSDIVYSDSVVKTLLSTKGDIVIAVDTDWEKSYAGRTDHPVSEAEKVSMNKDHQAQRLGKNIPSIAGELDGEFIGLIKLSPMGIRKWLAHFDALSASLSKNELFKGAPEFQKAYLTHFMQDLIDTGEPVECATFSGGWMEFDTPQDYEKLLRSNPATM